MGAGIGKESGLAMPRLVTQALLLAVPLPLLPSCPPVTLPQSAIVAAGYVLHQGRQPEAGEITVGEAVTTK